MALVKASAGDFDGEPLAEFEPHSLVLSEFEVLAPTGRFDNEKTRFKLVWDVEGDEAGHKIWDFMSVTLGQHPNGQPSKLRCLINALSGRSKGEHVELVDDATGDYWFDTSPGLTAYILDQTKPRPTPDGRVDIGSCVIARGTQEPAKDGKKNGAGEVVSFFRVSTYHPAKKFAAASAAKPAAGVHIFTNDPADF